MSTAAKRPRDAGFDEHQAEAAMSMVRDATGADRDALATKADLAEVRADLVGIESHGDANLAVLEARLTWRLVGIVAAYRALALAGPERNPAHLAGIERALPTFRAPVVTPVSPLGCAAVNRRDQPADTPIGNGPRRSAACTPPCAPDAPRPPERP